MTMDENVASKSPKTDESAQRKMKSLILCDDRYF